MAAKTFTVLYTHQKQKKSKTWQDGVLKFMSEHQGLLFNNKQIKLDSIFSKEDIKEGQELESDFYLIIIGEETGSSRSKQLGSGDILSEPASLFKSQTAVCKTQTSKLSVPHKPIRLGLKRTKLHGFVPPVLAKKPKLDNSDKNKLCDREVEPSLLPDTSIYMHVHSKANCVMDDSCTSMESCGKSRIISTKHEVSMTNDSKFPVDCKESCESQSYVLTRKKTPWPVVIGQNRSVNAVYVRGSCCISGSSDCCLPLHDNAADKSEWIRKRTTCNDERTNFQSLSEKSCSIGDQDLVSITHTKSLCNKDMFGNTQVEDVPLKRTATQIMALLMSERGNEEDELALDDGKQHYSGGSVQCSSEALKTGQADYNFSAIPPRARGPESGYDLLINSDSSNVDKSTDAYLVGSDVTKQKENSAEDLTNSLFTENSVQEDSEISFQISYSPLSQLSESDSSGCFGVSELMSADEEEKHAVQCERNTDEDMWEQPKCDSENSQDGKNENKNSLHTETYSFSSGSSFTDGERSLKDINLNSFAKKHSSNEVIEIGLHDGVVHPIEHKEHDKIIMDREQLVSSITTHSTDFERCKTTKNETFTKGNDSKNLNYKNLEQSKCSEEFKTEEKTQVPNQSNYRTIGDQIVPTHTLPAGGTDHDCRIQRTDTTVEHICLDNESRTTNKLFLPTDHSANEFLLRETDQEAESCKIDDMLSVVSDGQQPGKHIPLQESLESEILNFTGVSTYYGLNFDLQVDFGNSMNAKSGERQTSICKDKDTVKKGTDVFGNIETYVCKTDDKECKNGTECWEYCINEFKKKDNLNLDICESVQGAEVCVGDMESQVDVCENKQVDVFSKETAHLVKAGEMYGVDVCLSKNNSNKVCSNVDNTPINFIENVKNFKDVTVKTEFLADEDKAKQLQVNGNCTENDICIKAKIDSAFIANSDLNDKPSGFHSKCDNVGHFDGSSSILPILSDADNDFPADFRSSFHNLDDLEFSPDHLNEINVDAVIFQHHTNYTQEGEKSTLMDDLKTTCKDLSMNLFYSPQKAREKKVCGVTEKEEKSFLKDKVLFKNVAECLDVQEENYSRTNKNHRVLSGSHSLDGNADYSNGNGCVDEVCSSLYISEKIFKCNINSKDADAVKNIPESSSCDGVGKLDKRLVDACENKVNTEVSDQHLNTNDSGTAEPTCVYSCKSVETKSKPMVSNYSDLRCTCTKYSAITQTSICCAKDKTNFQTPLKISCGWGQLLPSQVRKTTTSIDLMHSFPSIFPRSEKQNAALGFNYKHRLLTINKLDDDNVMHKSNDVKAQTVSNQSYLDLNFASLSTVSDENHLQSNSGCSSMEDDRVAAAQHYGSSEDSISNHADDHCRDQLYLNSGSLLHPSKSTRLSEKNNRWIAESCDQSVMDDAADLVSSKLNNYKMRGCVSSSVVKRVSPVDEQMAKHGVQRACWTGDLANQVHSQFDKDVSLHVSSGTDSICAEWNQGKLRFVQSPTVNLKLGNQETSDWSVPVATSPEVPTHAGDQLASLSPYSLFPAETSEDASMKHGYQKCLFSFNRNEENTDLMGGLLLARDKCTYKNENCCVDNCLNLQGDSCGDRDDFLKFYEIGCQSKDQSFLCKNNMSAGLEKTHEKYCGKHTSKWMQYLECDNFEDLALQNTFSLKASEQKPVPCNGLFAKDQLESEKRGLIHKENKNHYTCTISSNVSTDYNSHTSHNTESVCDLSVTCSMNSGSPGTGLFMPSSFLADCRTLHAGASGNENNVRKPVERGSRLFACDEFRTSQHTQSHCSVNFTDKDFTKEIGSSLRCPYTPNTFQNSTNQFHTPLTTLPLDNSLLGSKRNLCGHLHFASKMEVENNSTPSRQITIPVSFLNIASYKQIFTAALREHLNIILFDLARAYHGAMMKVDLSSYRSTTTVGNLKGKNEENTSRNPCCHCGATAKLLQVKKESRNKGRFFYTCNANRNQQCKFFQWADKSSFSLSKVSSQRSRLELCDPVSIDSYMRSQNVPFYCECLLIRRVSKVSSTNHKWMHKKNYEDVTRIHLYLQLSHKDSSDSYSKDDLWIISQDLDFESSSTFIGKSAFYGPSSNGELEIEPLTGYSPSQWAHGMLCYAILAGNVSTEFTCMLNLQEHVNTLSVPILPYLLNGDGTVQVCSSRPFKKFSQTPNAKRICIPDGVLNDLIKGYALSCMLNADQEMALRHVASLFKKDRPDTDPVVLVHGVFGAGKSFLLAVFVLFLLKILEVSDDLDVSSRIQEKKLLVSSTTNVAVDRILLNLLDLGFEDFVRVGSLKKIAKPVLPYSVHAAGTHSQEIEDLEDMLKGDLTAAEKIFVRRSIEIHKLGKNRKKLQAAKVVGVTCASCVFTCLEKIKCFIVLLDECSQMTEPASMLPIARFNCEKLILVGDTKQLNPTISGSEVAHEEGLEQTLFDRLIKMGQKPIWLRTQYRCHPAISAIVNSLFYSGQLVNGVTADDRKTLNPHLPTLCFYDVNTGKECCDAAGSYFNMDEAQFVVHMIEALLTSGIEPASIGIITLYKSQAYQLATILGNSKIANESEVRLIQVSTVDAFQGGERDIIILSCVRTNSIGFINNVKRTNVALTRARHHMFIVGHLRNLSQNDLWSRIINHCRAASDGMQNAKEAWQKFDALINKDEELTDKQQQEADEVSQLSQTTKIPGDATTEQDLDEDTDSPPMSLSGIDGNCSLNASVPVPVQNFFLLITDENCR